MKKGYTLIELLTVLILLGIIAAITIPIIGGSIDISRKQSLAQTIEFIEDAALLYGTENVLPKEDKYNMITLEELRQKGYIESKDIINPMNNTEMTGCVLYKWEDQQFNYKYVEPCDLDVE